MTSGVPNAIDWDRFLARIAEGEGAVGLCTGANGLPSYRFYENRRKADPAFRAELARLKSANSSARAKASTAKRVATRRANIGARKRETVAKIDWAGFLSRVAAGERVQDICKGIAGMPPYRIYWDRLNTDEAFAAQVRGLIKANRSRISKRAYADLQAQGRGLLTNEPPVDDLHVEWERVLARHAAGERVVDICSGLDGMPTYRQYQRHRKRDVEFDGRSREIIERQLAESAKTCVIRGGAKWAETFAQKRNARFADIDWARALARLRDGEKLAEVCTGRDGMPSLHDWWRYLHDNPAFAAEAQFLQERKVGVPIAPERLKAFLDAYEHSSWSAALSSAKVSQATVMIRARTDAAFGAIYARLRDARRVARSERAQLRLRERLDRRRPDQFYREAVNRQLMANDVYAVVAKAVARVDLSIREDVRGEMILAVLDGALHLADVPAAVGIYMGEVRGQAGSRERASLDASRFDGGRTFGESYVDASFFDVGDMADLSAGWA